MSICSGEWIFLNGPGRALATLPRCWGWTGRTLASLPLLGSRNSSIRRLKPGEGSACQPSLPSRGVIVVREDRQAGPLSRGRKPSRDSSACRSDLPCVGRGAIPLSETKGVSPHGHVMVSPAVGRKRREKVPLKQCLKNTCRQAQKTRRCFSFRAPKTRSAGVELGGTCSASCVHLHKGGVTGSRAHSAKACCLGVMEC